ncbi:GNAT family N-acetyltransferase [Oscillospiraceae bacterium PP1C4]
MIRFVTPELEPIFQETIDTFGVFSVKIYSQYQTYGAQSGIADFWLAFDGAQVTGVISKLNGCLTIAALSDVDADELSAFLGAVGGKFADAELPLIERLGSQAESSWVLSFQQFNTPVVENLAGIFAPAERLRSAYDLLCLGSPQFSKEVPHDSWLTETSHKQRHHLADVYLLKVDNNDICTASIQFKSQTRAIIAGVATHPAYLRRGYGRQMIMHTVKESLGQGLVPYLLTGDDSLASFYQQCGFEITGRWGRIDLERHR